MYYHCRDLRHVEYGKVYPPPPDKVDDFFILAYKWLGNYCGYFPQVWLARSHLHLTGYKSNCILKKRQFVQQKRSYTKNKMDSVLFGFDIIKGFPVSFRYWELILMFLSGEGTLEQKNERLIQEVNEIVRDCKKDNSLIDEEMIAWDKCNGDLETFLKKYVFVEVDQVVVPSLNLKAAKQIICRNEKQKKKLRRMGFIEDRIVIKNFGRDTI